MISKSIGNLRSRRYVWFVEVGATRSKKGAIIMLIERVNIYQISLYFTGDFSHSRRSGPFVDNIIVELISEEGEIRGYGEGAPRLYATGESQENAVMHVSHLAQKDSFPWRLDNVSQIWDFVDSLPDGREHNAAICAMEMALLDTLGKSQNRYLLEYFPRDFYTGKVYYGAATTLSNKERIMDLCHLIRDAGIKHLRIKMGKDFTQNREAIETVRSVFDNDCDLRIDPNGVWDRDLALQHIPLIEKHKVKVVEEPMEEEAPGFAQFAETLRSMDVLLMACQSASTLKDVERLVKKGYHNMVNVKLSRSGGFRRSLRIIELLRNNGLSFQIGANLGESGVLSAAGRVLSLLCGDAKYYDGSYDQFILRENITTQHVSFGHGGEAGPLDGPGLGVKVNNQSLERLSDPSTRITIKRV